MSSLPAIENALFLENLVRLHKIPWKLRPKLFYAGQILAWEEEQLLSYLAECWGAIQMQKPHAYYEQAAVLLDLDVHLTYPGHPAWPAYLTSIQDPPLWLWYKGQPPSVLNDLAPVAVVGARQMIPYSKLLCNKIVQWLCEQEHPIISGLARGIDKTAHESCLNAGGLSAAVLPCGITECYPRSHSKLLSRLIEQGFVMTEFPPNYPIRKSNFHSRNRLISGLSIATVIIQAARKSGSSMTASLAMEQGRQLFVAPACLEMEAFAGSLSLIADGAAIIDCLDRLQEIPAKHSPALQAFRSTEAPE